MKQAMAVLVSALVVVATANAELLQMTAVRLEWPGISEVWRHNAMYFTSNPSEDGLRHAKSQGVQTIIDLMEPEEHVEPRSWVRFLLEQWIPSLKPRTEAEIAALLGLRYESVPLSVDEPSDAAVQRFLAIVQEVNARQLLVHCDVGGRALTMYAIYLGTVESYMPEAAVAQAEQAGLEHAGLKRFALDYLKRAAAHS